MWNLLGKILMNDICFAKFAKVFPCQNFGIMYIDHHTRCLIFYPIALNSSDSKNTDIAAIIDSVVECIFSVLVTLGRYSQEFMNS